MGYGPPHPALTASSEIGLNSTQLNSRPVELGESRELGRYARRLGTSWLAPSGVEWLVAQAWATRPATSRVLAGSIWNRVAQSGGLDWLDLAALCAPGRFGWLDLAALAAPGRPGWLDLAAQVALGRLGWLDLAALVAPGQPDWLELPALVPLGRTGCVDLNANECPNDAISKKNDLLIDDLLRSCLPRSLCNDASCLRSSIIYF